MMNPKELTQKTRDELLRLATDLRAEIRDFRFKIATRQHSKVRAIRHAKRDLARVMTTMQTKNKPTPTV